MALLKGKTAVITGGSTGIGLATAKRFVEEGAYVFINGRSQAELDAAVKKIGENVIPARAATAMSHGICYTPIRLPPSGDSVIDTKVRSAGSASPVSWPAPSATGSAAGSPVRCAVCRPGLGGR